MFSAEVITRKVVWIVHLGKWIIEYDRSDSDFGRSRAECQLIKRRSFTLCCPQPIQCSGGGAWGGLNRITVQ